MKTTIKTPLPLPITSHGFTLIELLVTIVIIITIAALSFAGYRQMRNSGDQALSTSNLRQMQAANYTYANDHNGQFVPLLTWAPSEPNNWYQNSEYLALLTGDQQSLENDQPRTTIVPTGILDPAVVRAKKRLWERLFASYGYNETGMTINNSGGTKYMKLSQVVDPSRTMVFATATDATVRYASRLAWLSNPTEGKTTDGKLAFRYKNKALVAYYDGSVGSVSPADIRRYDVNGGQNNPFWDPTP